MQKLHSHTYVHPEYRHTKKTDLQLNGLPICLAKNRAEVGGWDWKNMMILWVKMKVKEMEIKGGEIERENEDVSEVGGTQRWLWGSVSREEIRHREGWMWVTARPKLNHSQAISNLKQAAAFLNLFILGT